VIIGQAWLSLNKNAFLVKLWSILVELAFLLELLFFSVDFFLFTLFIVKFSFFNSILWDGSYFSLERVGFSLFTLSLFVFLFIYFISIYSGTFLILTGLLVLLCIFFFSSLFIFLHFLLLESILLPLLLMLLGGGSQIQKIRASYYLIFYSLCFSVPFLYIYLNTLIFFLDYYWVSLILHPFIILFLILVFLLKLPVYGLHFWLPKVHVEAPTVASIILASLLLKLGAYGFCLFLGRIYFIDINVFFILSFFSMIFLNLLCYTLSDTKKLAAYSSVVHIGLVLLSFLIFNSFSFFWWFLNTFSSRLCFNFNILYYWWVILSFYNSFDLYG